MTQAHRPRLSRTARGVVSALCSLCTYMWYRRRKVTCLVWIPPYGDCLILLIWNCPIYCIWSLPQKQVRGKCSKSNSNSIVYQTNTTEKKVCIMCVTGSRALTFRLTSAKFCLVVKQLLEIILWLAFVRLNKSEAMDWRAFCLYTLIYR